MTRTVQQADGVKHVESWLDALGLGSNSLKQGTDSQILARRLRHCLEGLGPLFVDFGVYLASRRDVLAPSLCDQLMKLPDHTIPCDYASIRKVICEELGRPPELAFERFETVPSESRFLWQEHRAAIAGKSILVRVIRPSAKPEADRADILALLQPCFEMWQAPAEIFFSMLADYQRELSDRLTFDSDIRAAELLHQDALEFGMVAAPEVASHLCTSHLFVQSESATFRPGVEANRLLCLVWLRQALRGGAWTVAPKQEAIGHRDDTAILFRHGPMASLEEPARACLEKYLTAVADQNADECATQITELYVRKLSVTESEEIRRRIRQMVPFREGSEVRAGELPARLERFTTETLIHWRLASQVRILDDPAVLAFFRGLHTLARSVESDTVEHDPVAEGFRDYRIVCTFHEMKKWLRPEAMVAMAENYATAFLRGPVEASAWMESFDKEEVPPSEHCRSSPTNGLVPGIAVVLAFASVALLLQRLEHAGAAAGPASALAALLLLAGIYVLYLCGRMSQ